MTNTNDGGPAFPVLTYEYKASGDLHPSPTVQSGMSLRDWYAGQEHLNDWDNPQCVPSKELAESLAGPQPEGGWCSGNVLAMVKWEAKWRAALKYIRADAMLAERAKGEK